MHDWLQLTRKNSSSVRSKKSYKTMGFTLLFSGESAALDEVKQFEAVLV